MTEELNSVEGPYMSHSSATSMAPLQAGGDTAGAPGAASLAEGALNESVQPLQAQSTDALHAYLPSIPQQAWQPRADEHHTGSGLQAFRTSSRLLMLEFDERTADEVGPVMPPGRPMSVMQGDAGQDASQQDMRPCLLMEAARSGLSSQAGEDFSQAGTLVTYFLENADAEVQGRDVCITGEGLWCCGAV